MPGPGLAAKWGVIRGMSPNPRTGRGSYTGPMDPVRPLRSVLDDLVGAGEAATDAHRALRAAGHGDLPPDLVTEAMVSFAAVAPPALAEQLAPFVTAQSAAGLDGDGDPAGADPAWGLELIGAASPVEALDELVDPGDLDDAAALDASPVPPTPSELPDDHHDVDLDFGGGVDLTSVTRPRHDTDPPADDLPGDDLPADVELDPGPVLDDGLDDGFADGSPAGPLDAPDDGADDESPDDALPSW